MDATTLLGTLKDDSPGGALDRLAALSVDHLLDRPLGALVTAEQAAQVLRQGLDGWLASPTAVPALTRLVDDAVNRLRADRRSLKEAVPRDLRHALRELVGRPFSPDKQVVLTIIDREPTRELVRQLLLDAILDFGRKVSSPVAGVAKGLGAFARMAGEAVTSRGGAIGGLVGAVSGEVERQLEKRAVEFVDAALAGVFGQLADSVSDPRRATEAAELRVALFDGALELTGAQLGRELLNGDVPGGAEVLRAGLRRWLASAQSDAQLLQAATALLAGGGQRTAREALAEAGLLETARAAAHRHLRARLAEVVGSAAFAQWLAEVAR